MLEITSVYIPACIYCFLCKAILSIPSPNPLCTRPFAALHTVLIGLDIFPPLVNSPVLSLQCPY